MRDAAYYRRNVHHDPSREAEVAPLRYGTEEAQASIREALGNPTAGKKHAVPAAVNEGRWVVECPDCGSAQLASESDKRFLCHECANITLDGKWRPVAWPQDRGDIEDALGEREVRRQHWLPGESVADLMEETVRHGRASTNPGSKVWEGHTHTWPKRLPKSGDVECEECHLVLPASLIRADRKENT